jgi:hypothetical protein
LGPPDFFFEKTGFQGSRPGTASFTGQNHQRTMDYTPSDSMASTIYIPLSLVFGNSTLFFGN